LLRLYIRIVRPIDDGRYLQEFKRVNVAGAALGDRHPSVVNNVLSMAIALFEVRIPTEDGVRLMPMDTPPILPASVKVLPAKDHHDKPIGVGVFADADFEDEELILEDIRGHWVDADVAMEMGPKHYVLFCDKIIHIAFLVDPDDVAAKLNDHWPHPEKMRFNRAQDKAERLHNTPLHKKPNCVFWFNDEDPFHGPRLSAKRDIKKGEELLVHYGPTFNWDEDKVEDPYVPPPLFCLRPERRIVGAPASIAE